jgi:hypothetical protein
MDHQYTPANVHIVTIMIWHRLRDTSREPINFILAVVSACAVTRPLPSQTPRRVLATALERTTRSWEGP